MPANDQFWFMTVFTWRCFVQEFGNFVKNVHDTEKVKLVLSYHTDTDELTTICVI